MIYKTNEVPAKNNFWRWCPGGRMRMVIATEEVSKVNRERMGLDLQDYVE